MQVKHFLATVLVSAFALGTMTISVTGCDQKAEDEDDDGGKKKKKKKKKDDDDDEEDEKAEPAASTETPASDEAQACDGQVKIGGLRKVLKPLSVYVAADQSSKKLTGLAPGTHVELKYQCGNWIMLDYPSGVGEMSPGWVNVAVHSSKWKDETAEERKKDEEKKEEEEKKDDEEKKEEEEKKDDEEKKEEEEKKDDEEKPAEEKPAEEKPAEEKPAEEKPAEEKPAEEKPADKPADRARVRGG